MPVPQEDIPFLKAQGYTDEEIANLSPIQQQQPDSISIPQTIGRTAKAHAGGYVGGGAGVIAGMYAGGELGALGGPAAPITIPLGAIVGGAIGAGIGGYAGQKGQEAIESPETYAAQQEAAQQAAEQNPKTALATDIVAGALASGGMLSPTTAVKGLSGIAGRLIGRPLTAEAKNVLLQAAINPAISTGMSVAQGQGIPSGQELLGQAAGGALFAKSWLPHGRLGTEPNAEVTNKADGLADTASQQSGVEAPVLDSAFTATDENGDYKIGDKQVARIFKNLDRGFLQPIPKDADDITKAYISTQNEKLASLPPDQMRQMLHQQESNKSVTPDESMEYEGGEMPNLSGMSNVETKPEVTNKATEANPTVPEDTGDTRPVTFTTDVLQRIIDKGATKPVAVQRIFPNLNLSVQEATEALRQADLLAELHENRPTEPQGEQNATGIRENTRQLNPTGKIGEGSKVGSSSDLVEETPGSSESVPPQVSERLSKEEEDELKRRVLNSAPSHPESDFLSNAAYIIQHPEEMGLYKNRSGVFSGTQLLGTLKNKITPVEWDLLQKAGIEKAFEGRKISGDEASKWIQDNEPKAQVVSYGMEGKVSEAKKEYDKMTHEWYETMPYEHRDSVDRAIKEAQRNGTDRNGDYDSWVNQAVSEGAKRSEVEKYTRLAERVAKEPKDTSPRATSHYSYVSALPTTEPMPEWTATKSGKNVQRVDVVLPPKPGYQSKAEQMSGDNWKTKEQTGVLWQPDNLHENLPNTLGWAMIQYKTGPKPVKGQGKWYIGTPSETLSEGHRGYFLTDDPDVASRFGKLYEANPNVKKTFDANNEQQLNEFLTAYLKERNVSNVEQFKQQLKNGNHALFEDWLVKDNLQKLGYDSNLQTENGAKVLRVFNKDNAGKLVAVEPKKIAVIVEAQSRWGQEYRKELNAKDGSPIGRYTAEEMYHPLLHDYNRLILKAAIAQARKEGATHIMVSDAETAMMTEEHDHLRNPGVDLQGLQETGRTADDYIQQAKGMRLNYDTILPKIAEELTGNKGEKVSLGEHKNALGEYGSRYELTNPKTGEVRKYDYSTAQMAGEHNKVQREIEKLISEGWKMDRQKDLRTNLIFRNADGTPKTDISGMMYPIDKIPNRNPKLFGKNYSALSDYNRYNELQNQMAKLGPRAAHTPEWQAAWNEANDIKNRNGGMPPKPFPENRVMMPVPLQHHIISNKATTGSILHGLANTPDHPLQELAKGLLDAADTKSLGVKWFHDSQLDRINESRSHYDPSTDQVNIGTGSSGDARVVMEEVVHSLTSKKVPFFKGQGAEHYNRLQTYLKNGKNELVKDLIRSYFETAKALGIHDKLFTDAKDPLHQTIGAAGNPEDAVKMNVGYGDTTKYAMGSLDEFMAQAIKDPEFQRVLEGIKTQDNRTVWQTIVDSVKKLLGLNAKTGSMLERVLRTSGELVSQERPDEVTQSTYRIQSKAPDELNLPKDKYMGRFGLMFRSVIDKVRDIKSPLASKLADHFQMAADKETELKGQWKNLIVQAGEHLTSFDKQKLSDTFNAELATKTPHSHMLTNTAQRTFYKLARAKLLESGDYRLKIGEPVTQAISKGNKTIYIQRDLKKDPMYYPGMANQKVMDVYRQNTDQAAIAAHDKEFNEYNTKTLGLTPQESQERIQNFKTALQGSVKNSDISHQDYFNAHRKAEGSPLPPSFREADPVRNLERYFDRAAIDASHYEFLEKDPAILSTLGQKKNAWGVEVPPSQNSSLANNPSVRAALEHWRGEVRNPAEYNESSLASLFSSSFIAGPALELHKVVSNVVKALGNTSNPIVLARAVAHSLTNIQSGYQHAVENGVVKLTSRSALGMVSGSYTAAERMQSLARLIRKVSTVGDLTTKLGSGLVQSMNEVIIPSKIARANAGSVSDQLFIKRLDPTYTKGREYSEQEMQLLASRSANYIHGTGDIRSLPAWMLNDSEFSGFFSLAHWSIAQTNNFMKEVYEPATRGDIKPLVMGLFGAALGGYVIKELRQDIQGKKSQIPSLSEIAASDKGLEGNKGLLAYNLMAACTYAGFGGLLSQIAKYPFDFAYKNQPMGATFPMDEIASDTAETVHYLTTAMINDPNVNYLSLAQAAAMHMLSTNFQLSRIAINQGINNGLITGLPAEKKLLSDKVGQLRRFDMVEGLPYNEVDQGSNPYMNLEQKKFKMEQNIEEAVKQLPSLISNIIEHYGDKPDVLMAKLKALKQNSYETFPSLEQMPISMMKYIGYLERMEGPEQAQNELQDYLKRKMVNEVKSSAIP